jgi:hypothetical protein
MALTPFQRDVCRLLADRRRSSGESYIAGGVALTAALDAQRVSRDLLDTFHDTVDAVSASRDADRRLLETAAYQVRAQRERPGFVEAEVARHGATLTVVWARDSAFRFFPLVEHEEFGLVLHAFDLATNKLLALIGRTEARDWIDVIACHPALQPLGYLAWAACGKDPGFTPAGILAHAGRTSRYSQVEIDALAFAGEAPSAAALSRSWHEALDEARAIVTRLPGERAGMAVLRAGAALYKGEPATLDDALALVRCGFMKAEFVAPGPRSDRSGIRCAASGPPGQPGAHYRRLVRGERRVAVDGVPQIVALPRRLHDAVRRMRRRRQHHVSHLVGQRDAQHVAHRCAVAFRDIGHGVEEHGQYRSSLIGGEGHAHHPLLARSRLGVARAQQHLHAEAIVAIYRLAGTAGRAEPAVRMPVDGDTGALEHRAGHGARRIENAGRHGRRVMDDDDDRGGVLGPHGRRNTGDENRKRSDETAASLHALPLAGRVKAVQRRGMRENGLEG